MDRNPKESAIQPRINPAVEQRNAGLLIHSPSSP